MAKRALLVGCNYPGTKVELHGCVNDVRRMHTLLTSRYGFDESDILVLVDTDESGMQPTGVNIRSCLAKLIRGTEAGDVLVLHYSGHGTQVPPEAGEAADDTGAEEAIVPTDMNLLTDDDFRDLVNEISPGATFTFISDSCHSGGLIDAEKEQIGDSEGGGGGLFGMVANAFQGSSEGRDFEYGGQRRRNQREQEEEELGEDEEPGYGRRRRGGYGEEEEGYEGRQESEDERYGGRREGYGGRRESEFEGYGGRRKPEDEGYGGRRESEYEGYGGRREPEYEGYGGRREPEYGGYGGRQKSESEGYGGRRQEYDSGGGEEYAYAQQLESDESYGGGYGRRSARPVVSKEIPVDLLTQILSQRTGHEVSVGNIRTTLFDMFGENASPSVKAFANLVLQQLQGGQQDGFVGAVSSLAMQFLQSKLDDQDEEHAANYVASAQNAGEYRPRPQRRGAATDCGILLSGCQSDETSADANPSGNTADSYGAFSNGIQTVLSQTDGPISNRDLILQVRKVLAKQGFKQHPCLYCSDDNADAPFISE